MGGGRGFHDGLPSGPGRGPIKVTSVTEPAYEYMRDEVFVIAEQAYVGTSLILTLLVGLVVLNAYRARFWCRFLCPLGALLGLLSVRALLRLQADAEWCNSCELCGMGCQGGTSQLPPQRWRPAECFGCLNCTESCRPAALRFVLPWRWEPRVEPVGLTRRAMLGSAVGGVATLAFMRATPQGRRRRLHPFLIRPPGALAEREFLQRFTACGLCMKVCPTGGLQPSLSEAGVEGLWTPILVPRLGYCKYDCTLCGQVCLTGAIEPLPIEEKHKGKIGLARFDTSRCLPSAYGRECVVCEEHCPVPAKAIYAVEVDVVDRAGERRVIKQPRVDPGLCTGCGVRENKCVFRDRPAIRVYSTNESLNPDNQPILPLEEGYP